MSWLVPVQTHPSALPQAMKAKLVGDFGSIHRVLKIPVNVVRAARCYT